MLRNTHRRDAGSHTSELINPSVSNTDCKTLRNANSSCSRTVPVSRGQQQQQQQRERQQQEEIAKVETYIAISVLYAVKLRLLMFSL